MSNESIIETSIDALEEAGVTGELTLPDGRVVCLGQPRGGTLGGRVFHFTEDEIRAWAAPFGEPADFPFPRTVYAYDFTADGVTDPFNRFIMKTARDNWSALYPPKLVAVEGPDGNRIGVYVGDILAPGDAASDGRIREDFKRWVQTVSRNLRETPHSHMGWEDF